MSAITTILIVAFACALCSDAGVGNLGDLCPHVASDYPGFSGRAQAPVSGPITALKLRRQCPMTFIAKLVNVRHLSANGHSGQAQAVVRSRRITLPGPTHLDNGAYPAVKVSLHL